MSTGKTLLMAMLFAAFICITAAAASKRPGDTWNYYHFDGRAFVAGKSSGEGPFVALRERMMPVLVTGTAKIEAVALSHGKGVVTGICYIQNSGGKLAPSGGYTPVPHSLVRISSGSKVIATTETDERGYFMILLDAGRYTIGSGSMQSEVEVDSGKTILVPMRIGKRMVD